MFSCISIIVHSKNTGPVTFKPICSTDFGNLKNFGAHALNYQNFSYLLIIDYSRLNVFLTT